MKILKLIIVFVCLCGNINAQEFSEAITKELKFKNELPGSFLVINNVYGFINVEGYEGSSIKIEIDKKIKGINNKGLEKGKKEILVKVIEKGSSIYVYLDSPYTNFNIETVVFKHKSKEYYKRQNYNYLLNFKVLVPKNTNLKLRTINGGDINVKNIDANRIIINNTNGGIILDNISGQIYAHSVNKNINISYKENPKKESLYKTLNGNITITVKENLNANIFSKIKSGNLYTNLVTSKLSNETTSIQNKVKKGTEYKLNRNEKFKIGGGGVKLTFDVGNGNVTIKNKSYETR